MHESVLVDEILSFLKEKSGGLILDATLGNAGHTKVILDKLGGSTRVIGLDQDEDAIERAKKVLDDSNYLDKVEIHKTNFVLLDTVLENKEGGLLDACLIDAGVSKNQLLTAERGFSVNNDGPLDMRMDKSSELTAKDLVNRLEAQELYTIIKKYGEERNARRISQAIVRARDTKLIETTGELAEIVTKANRSKRYTRIHPATRTFQALRIAVNNELEVLEEGIQKVLPYLKPDGLICVIAFHSLEDRIVKLQFRDWAREGLVKVLTKKPIVAGAAELERNRNARSAKLRVAKRSLQGEEFK